MASSANFASIPRIGACSISTANALRDGNGALGLVFQAGIAGSRIDRLQVQAAAATTAGMIRLFLVSGRVMPAISSLTFVSTTATATTAAPHLLATGDRVTLQGMWPTEYNVSNVAVTVTGPNTFTFALPTTPLAAASTIGYGVSTVAAPPAILWRELAVTVATPSATAQAFATSLTGYTSVDILPLVLPAGWSLRAATEKAEAFNVYAHGADL